MSKTSLAANSRAFAGQARWHKVQKKTRDRIDFVMEQEILLLLTRSPGQAFSSKEVSKTLDREQFREDPNWARPFLQNLTARQFIEKDKDGRYFKPKPKES